MVKYLIVIERTERNYSAYCPDLPGCAATGATHDEVVTNMQEAIRMHLAGLQDDHLPIPEPQTSAEYLAVS